MRFQTQIACSIILSASLLFAACQPLRVANQPATSAQPVLPVSFCPLRIVGNEIQTGDGRVVVLQGANLPSISDMDASVDKPEARLRKLAEAGARWVRLPISDEEFTAAFIPEKVLPLADLANQLNMAFIMSWHQPVGTRPIKIQAEEIEDWLRITLNYVGNRPGIWLDPFGAPLAVTPGKLQAVAQRMSDVLNGYRHKNLLLISDPVWMVDSDPKNTQQLLKGANVIYGLSDFNALPKYPTDKAPFVWLSLDNPAYVPANMSTLALDTQPPAALQTFWQAQPKFDLTNCK